MPTGETMKATFQLFLVIILSSYAFSIYGADPCVVTIIDTDLYDLAKVNTIDSEEGKVHILEGDTSGADPEGNFNSFNLTILESKENNAIKGYKRPIKGGICTETCNPSDFIIVTDSEGNFTHVEPSEPRGLQTYGHKKMSEMQIKALNKFIAKEIQKAEASGNLSIKNIIGDLGHKKLQEQKQIDAISGATKIIHEREQLVIPQELKGSFNTVVTVLLYAYDTETHVRNIKSKQ
jgi:hypothetical protein